MNDGAPLDVRLPVLAAGAWASAIATHLVPSETRFSLLALIGLAFVFVLLRSSGAKRRTVATAGLLWLTVAIALAVRGEVVDESWIATAASDRASATLTVRITSDARVKPGLNEDRATVHATTISTAARAHRSSERVRVVLVLPAAATSDLEVGARYRVHARLATSPFADTAATVIVNDRPIRVRGPGWIDRASAHVRDAMQEATRGQTDSAGLVPALIDGDERAVPSGVEADFKTAGLTHLMAVSGTNFVLLGAAWMALARRVGVRGRGTIPIGLLGIVALVVLARAEPSVIRAAVMGAVALIGLGHGRRNQGVRMLSACICLVMLFQPELATSPGFALSALATAGILVFAGRWRDAMASWMPTILAEAIAVGLAAYIACLPMIVALSGRLSIVAIPANLAAGVVVGPATVLGFVGGVVGMVLPALGRVIAAPATWCASWIVEVAHFAARAPHPDVGLGVGAVVVALLAAAALLLASNLERVLLRPKVALPALSVSMLAGFVTVPMGSWPPTGWVFVACDVGQGDGLVVSLGEHRAMVVDTGPEPEAMRRCLRDLRIREAPTLVLTHFHADHVNGLSSVLDSTKVGTIVVTNFAEPKARAAFVQEKANAAHVTVEQAQPGTQHTEGDVTWQILAPVEPPEPSSESPPNDASVVLLVQTHGIRILLMGDEETDTQRVLYETYPTLKVDVLKVAHHGSAKQDPDLIASIGAKHAIISAGTGNSYGLPKASTLALLTHAGMQIHRTDLGGAQAVVIDQAGSIRVIAHGRP